MKKITILYKGANWGWAVDVRPDGYVESWLPRPYYEKDPVTRLVFGNNKSIFEFVQGLNQYFPDQNLVYRIKAEGITGTGISLVEAMGTGTVEDVTDIFSACLRAFCEDL